PRAGRDDHGQVATAGEASDVAGPGAVPCGPVVVGRGVPAFRGTEVDARMRHGHRFLSVVESLVATAGQRCLPRARAVMSAPKCWRSTARTSARSSSGARPARLATAALWPRLRRT